ncbi:MAG TPA: hypothetical protein VMR62_11660 [Bryobacteraceae bacterium]|nr:hypothetical protein [Bryobacteraceae bacterium]
MADIEMIGGSGLHMDRTDESEIQKGGSGEIDMFGGSDLHLKHSPIGSEQKGGKGGDIDMVGVQGILNKTPVFLHGSTRPTDKGEI